MLGGPGFEEGFDDAAAFQFGDVDPEIGSGLQLGVDHGCAGVEDHDSAISVLSQPLIEGVELDGFRAGGGVLGAGVFQLGDDLDGDWRVMSAFKKFSECGLVQGVAMEAWVETEDFDVEVVDAMAEVILPGSLAEVDAGDWLPKGGV